MSVFSFRCQKHLSSGWGKIPVKHVVVELVPRSLFTLPPPRISRRLFWLRQSKRYWVAAGDERVTVGDVSPRSSTLCKPAGVQLCSFTSVALATTEKMR